MERLPLLILLALRILLIWKSEWFANLKLSFHKKRRSVRILAVRPNGGLCLLICPLLFAARLLSQKLT